MIHLEFGKPFTLASVIDYPEERTINQQVLKTPAGWATLFAFAANAEMKSHTAPGDVLLQVLEGEAHVSLNNSVNVVTSGESILLPANIPHSVQAGGTLKMLVTMIKT